MFVLKIYIKILCHYKILCIYSFPVLFVPAIYRHADCVSKNPNSIIVVCITPIVYIHSLIRQWWESVC